MRDALPDFIDPMRQAADPVPLKGVWPAGRCPRVADAVSRIVGNPAVELRFARRAEDEVDIEGRLRVTLELICQRCLQPMRRTIDEPLGVTAVGRAPPEERREVIEFDERGLIAVGPWIEDEILLRVPMAPKHADRRECDPRMTERGREAGPEREDAENPFSVLKDLK